MSNKVYIVAGGITKFGEHWNKNLRMLAVEAGLKALENANIEGEKIEALYITNMTSGNFIGQEHLGALIADYLALKPVEALRIEGACSSGGLGLRQAFLAIKSGNIKAAMVLGVEKMTDVSTGKATYALANASDNEFELFFGATFPGLYALMARAYMHKYNITEQDLAYVAVKNHEHALNNSYAQFNRKITVDDVLNSSYVAEPLKLLDCSPITDGSAAVIVASEEFIEENSHLKENAVEIKAIEVATDSIALMHRESLTSINAAKVAASKAYSKAGINSKDIDFAEVHDCFTIAEFVAYNDLGFYKPEEIKKVVEEKLTTINGEKPVNVSGGLKACGHPVGATGVKQAYEIFLQLNGFAEKEKRQVSINKGYALSHNVGGSGATAVVGIYKKEL